MPESLDLDALRENLRVKAEYDKLDGLTFTRVIPEQMLAVLALVEEQRKENERLREYVDANEAWMDAVNDLSHDGTARLRFVRARAALAGSPAENKEPT